MNGDTLQLHIFLNGQLVHSGSLHRSQMSTMAVRGIVNEISGGKWKIVGPLEEKAESNEVIINVADETQSSKKG